MCYDSIRDVLCMLYIYKLLCKRMLLFHSVIVLNSPPITGFTPLLTHISFFHLSYLQPCDNEKLDNVMIAHIASGHVMFSTV